MREEARAQILHIGDFRHLDRFHLYPRPLWVRETGALLVHPVPRGLNAMLVSELGNETLFIGHCIALAQICGVTTADFAIFFAAIAEKFGAVAWSDDQAVRIGGFIDAPGLDGRADELLERWETDSVPNRTAKEVLNRCLAEMTARRSIEWTHLAEIGKHLVLLIHEAQQAIRLTAP
jgi:hypothetical protein